MSPRDAGRRALSLVRAAVMPDLPFYVLVFTYMGAALVLHAIFGVPGRLDISLAWRMLGVMSLLYLVAAAVLACTRAALDPDRRVFDVPTWRRRASERTPPARIASFLLLLGLSPFWFHVFVRFKVAIPEVIPFSLDVLFMNMDRIVHFGVHPWIALQPLFGEPALTQALDLVYYAWFPVVWITFVWQALHGSDGALRSQFVLAFGLCWILLGTVAATLL
ncbi:MAG: hypothetical protein ACE5FP_03595, partial [Gemmatimonadota bacterium]